MFKVSRISQSFFITRHLTRSFEIEEALGTRLRALKVYTTRSYDIGNFGSYAGTAGNTAEYGHVYYRIRTAYRLIRKYAVLI